MSRPPFEKFDLSDTDAALLRTALLALETVVKCSVVALIAEGAGGRIEVIPRPGLERYIAQVLRDTDWATFRRVVEEHTS